MDQKGASLVEVMVAVAILASGLLGLGALQANSIQMNQSAHNRSIAADLSTDLAERIRASRSIFITSSDVEAGNEPPYPPDFSQCTLSVSTVTCATQSTTNPYRETYSLGDANAANEMKTWYATLSNQLPGAIYTLNAADATTAPYDITYTLTITWPDNRGVIKTEDPANFSYVAVIK